MTPNRMTPEILRRTEELRDSLENEPEWPWFGPPEEEEMAVTVEEIYETELNLFVHLRQGMDGHIKITGVPHNRAIPALDALAELAADKYNMTASTRFGSPKATATTGTGAETPRIESQSAPEPPRYTGNAENFVPPCENCGGPVWDNRTNKRNPKGPDFTCKDKEGCGWRAWVTKDGGLNWKAAPL